MTPVPERYRGVWARTLLQTPDRRDDTTFVRWLQAARHHADLRIPAGVRDAAAQQGFFGLTTVEAAEGGEVCHWHRQLDLQPPGLSPDAGRMVFETPDRVVETGVHGDYLEVWERLPGSTGASAVLACGSTRLLITGNCVMRVRPRSLAWPGDTQAGDTLAQVVQRHAAQRDSLLDFEISFGHVVAGRWSITQSTLASLEGQQHVWDIQRLSDHEAVQRCPLGETVWQVLEWDGPAVLSA